MRSFLATLVLVLLVTTVANSETSDFALVAVDASSPEVRAGELATHLVSLDFTVVRDMGSYALIVISTEDLLRLQETQLSWRELDPSIEGKSYYTVVRRSGRDFGEVEFTGRILRSDRFSAVIEAAPEEAVKFAEAQFEIARAFIRPIRLSDSARVEREPHEPREPRSDPDPLIAAMTAQVSGQEVDASVQRLQDFVTRHASHDSCFAAAEWIKAEFESFGIDSVEFQLFGGQYAPNVVAVIPGVGNPDEMLLIGGHYDSITQNYNNCPGADDDASGTACVIECARVLSQYQFGRTLIFVAFGAEELGLYGSEAYAQAALARGDDIVAAVAVDMIGYLESGDPMDLDLISNASSEWVRSAAIDAALTYVPDLPTAYGSLPGGSSSDHASFWSAGYDAILFFEDSSDSSPYIHTTSDIVGLSYNSPVFAERSVKVATALLATLAEPLRVAIYHEPLENTEITNEPYRVVADLLFAGAPNPDSLLVRYSTGIGFHDEALIPTGDGNEYEAFIPAQPGGTFVDYYIVAEDSDGHRSVHPTDAPTGLHQFFVGTITTYFEDDFESDKGWTVGDVDDNAFAGFWVRADPNGTWADDIMVQPEDDHTEPTGVACCVTGNAPPGSGQGENDVDGGKTTLLSPVFDLSGYAAAWVRYYRWYTNDTGAGPQTDDWVVDVSDDGGTNWTRLETDSYSDRSWRLVEVNLNTLIELTDQVRLRFIATDDAPSSIVEAGVDDFSIIIYEENLTDVTEELAGGVQLFLSPSAPNPFRQKTTIEFVVPEPGARVRLGVYDVAGRKVATLLSDEQVVGPRSVDWDGHDDSGRMTNAGIYFIRLHVNGQILTDRMVRVR